MPIKENNNNNRSTWRVVVGFIENEIFDGQSMFWILAQCDYDAFASCNGINRKLVFNTLEYIYVLSVILFDFSSFLP